MKIQYLTYPNQLVVTDLSMPFSVALGFFDGVHIGHQQVIANAKKIADENGWKSAVMTFDPHPSIVLGHRKESVFYITPFEQKVAYLEEMGIDVLFVIRFTSDFASLSAEQFIEQVLVANNVKHITAGFDFNFGALGKGNMNLLRDCANGRYEVTEMAKVADSEEKISSTRIREQLKQGNMGAVHQMLGRPYEISGIVVHGDKRGRTIGFPTANIQPNEGSFTPLVGVYAVKMLVQGNLVEGVCNVGYKPTVQDEKKLSIEVNLFNFDKDIYGEHVSVYWYDHIRDEKKFSGLDELKGQIEKDKQRAISILASN